MQLKAFLNRVQKFKSFVYGRVRWDEAAREPTIEVEVQPRRGSGLVLIPPSQWMPAVWGDVEPQWQNEQQVQQVMGLLMGPMNGIAQLLMDEPGDFEPLGAPYIQKGLTER